MTQSIVEQTITSGRKLNEKQHLLLDTFRKNGFKGREAALVAGYAESGVSAVLRNLKDELLDMAEMELVEAAPTAAKTMVDIMQAEEPVKQGALKLQASQTVLDRVGLGRREKVDHTHEVKGGLFILPSKGTLPIIDGEVVDE